MSLAALTSEQPYLLARVERFEVEEQSSDESLRLEQELRQRVRSFSTTLPDGERLQRLTDGMSALQLADASMANLTCSVEARAAYAAQRDLTSRLRHVIALFP